MRELEIHLQSGFDVDTVLVRADGGEVGELLAVSTHPASGFAAVLRAPRTQCCVRLQVVVPSRRLRHEVVLHPAVTPYVAVSIDDTRVHIHLSPRAFRYALAVPSRRHALAPAARSVIRCPRHKSTHHPSSR